MQIFENYDEVILFVSEKLIYKADLKKKLNLGLYEAILGDEFDYQNQHKNLMLKRKEEIKANNLTIENFDIRKFFKSNFSLILDIVRLNTSAVRDGKVFNIDNVFSKKRQRNLVFARQLLVYCLLKNNVLLKSICIIYNNTNHSTIINSRENMTNYIQFNADKITKKMINDLTIKTGEALCKSN